MDEDPTATGIAFSGSLRISCEDFHFQLRGSNQQLVADFPSLGMLFRAKGMANQLADSLRQLPPLPPMRPTGQPRPGRSFMDFMPEIRIAVNARPLGRLDFGESKPKFVATPLWFFKKI